MTAKSPRQLVSEVERLVSFPAAAARIADVAARPESTARDVGHAFATDPALTARVLRVAGSALYGGTAPDSIERAVNVLGRRRVAELALGVSAIHAFDGIPVEVVSMTDYWSHSIQCALLAEEVARAGRPAFAESAFTGGLLHDIGQLVLFTRAGDNERKALLDVAAHGEEISLADAENDVLGFTHMEVGLELAGAWNLPRSLTAVIGHHHRPEDATAHTELVAIVHLANSLAVLAETESSDLDSAPRIWPGAWDRAGVRPSIVPELLSRAAERFDAVSRELLAD